MELRRLSYYPHIQSAWTYPYAWSHGAATRDYGPEYHVANTLAQMAGVRRHPVGDPISSSTMSPPADPGIITDHVTRPPSRMVNWEQNSQGAPPNITIQPPDESLLRNTVIDVHLLSPEAHEVKPVDGRIPLFSAQKLKLRPFCTRAVRTDVYWQFPENIYGDIRVSGREEFRDRGVEALPQKVSQVPSDGIVVMLHNTSDRPYSLNIGAEIAEIVLVRVLQPIVRTQTKTKLKLDNKKEPKLKQPRGQPKN